MKVLSAKYGNKLNTLDEGVSLETDEAGWVSTSTRDAPYSGGAWEALQEWLAAGNKITLHPETE